MAGAKGVGKKKWIIGVARTIGGIIMEADTEGDRLREKEIRRTSIGWGYSNRGISELRDSSSIS
jgi:hypothetical protein